MFVGFSGQRHRSWTRGSLGADRGRHSLSDRTKTRVRFEQAEGADSRRHCGRDCRGVQHADCRRAVHDGRSYWRLARSGAWVDRAQLRNCMDGASHASRRRAAVSRSQLSVSPPGRVRRLRGSGGDWGAVLRRVRETDTDIARAVPAIPEIDQVVSARRRRAHGGHTRIFYPGSARRRIQLCEPGAEQRFPVQAHGCADHSGMLAESSDPACFWAQ